MEIVLVLFGLFVSIVVLLAIVRLFSIDGTLKAILAELHAARHVEDPSAAPAVGQTGTSSTAPDLRAAPQVGGAWTAVAVVVGLLFAVVFLAYISAH